MKLQDIELGVLEYVRNEIAAKTTGFKKFLIYSGTALGATRGEALLNEYLPTLQKMNLITSDGDIDVTSLYQAAKLGIKESGDFVFAGFRFNEQDIDTLFEYIKTGGKQ